MDLQRRELEAIGFEEACKSIKSIWSSPFEPSDREYAQSVRVRDLLSNMLSVGSTKRRAIKLIAEKTASWS